MGKGLFIAGTGTDIGKTYVAGLIVKRLRDAGYHAGYYKAALSGAERTAQGLLPGDADRVNRIARIGGRPERMVSYVYQSAVSPHLAARIEGNPVEMPVVEEGYQRAAAEYDLVTMEGSGGIVCPIRWDGAARILQEDIVRRLGLATVVIAPAGLGAINAAVLTAAYMAGRNLPVRGFIFNRFQAGDAMHEDNVAMVQALTGIPVIGLVGEGDAELGIDAEELAALYG
jgi:dethiobiotin synthetase